MMFAQFVAAATLASAGPAMPVTPSSVAPRDMHVIEMPVEGLVPCYTCKDGKE